MSHLVKDQIDNFLYEYQNHGQEVLLSRLIDIHHATDTLHASIKRVISDVLCCPDSDDHPCADTCNCNNSEAWLPLYHASMFYNFICITISNGNLSNYLYKVVRRNGITDIDEFMDIFVELCSTFTRLPYTEIGGHQVKLVLDPGEDFEEFTHHLIGEEEVLDETAEIFAAGHSFAIAGKNMVNLIIGICSGIVDNELEFGEMYDVDFLQDCFGAEIIFSENDGPGPLDMIELNFTSEIVTNFNEKIIAMSCRNVKSARK